MAEIKFKNLYSRDKQASPFWLVWCEARNLPSFKHPTMEAAEAEAARLASFNPGEQFHVLGVLATIQTSPDIIGTRFDPSKTPPAPPVVEEPAPEPTIVPLAVDDDPEFAEVSEAPKHSADAFAEALDDDQPF
jgi:hypothetical protein